MNQVKQEKTSHITSERLRPTPGLKADRKSAEAFHVMDFIREEMDERDWSIWTLVRHMSDDQSDEALGRIKLCLELTDLRDPHMFMGNEEAQWLAKAFGTSADVWLNLDKTWREAEAAKADAYDALVAQRDALATALRLVLDIRLGKAGHHLARGFQLDEIGEVARAALALIDKQEKENAKG